MNEGAGIVAEENMTEHYKNLAKASKNIPLHHHARALPSHLGR
ncbi:hypothetical protein [Segniliparus rugosus]|nr:hypothetical protein [Segniliparus rugosus]